MSDPATEHYVNLLREVVLALERMSADVHKLSDEQVRHEIHEEHMISELKDLIDTTHETVTSELRRHGEQVATILTLWKAEQDAAIASTNRRDKAFTTVWQSAPFQLLMAGLVVAILQILGTSWVASHYLPTPAETVTAPPSVSP